MKYLSKKEIFNEVKKEYKLWIKGGILKIEKTGEYKDEYLFVDFMDYLKNKYKPKDWIITTFRLWIKTKKNYLVFYNIAANTHKNAFGKL